MRRDKDRLAREWAISDRRGATLEEDLEIFFGDLCKSGGFCNAAPRDVLAVGKSITAESFALCIIAAEGWPEPDREYEYRPKLVRLFTDRYGPSISPKEYGAY